MLSDLILISFRMSQLVRNIVRNFLHNKTHLLGSVSLICFRQNTFLCPHPKTKTFFSAKFPFKVDVKFLTSFYGDF